MVIPKVLISLFIFFVFPLYSSADIIYLKNGRSVVGIVKNDNAKTVELEVGEACQVSFLKSEIENIVKGSSDNSLALRRKWQENKIESEEKAAKQKLEEEGAPSSVKFSSDQQGITVKVILNNKVEAKMVLDTGASVMIITKNIADKLKIDLTGSSLDMKAQVVGGHEIKAKRAFIDRVEVQGVEARNVEAAVLLDDTGKSGFGDGLLGMSFLKRFNFKVDQKNKKLILEKL
ncbi:MAG: retropepsin-like aspartic protease [Candidatus Omnitrophica bacterium]|nr:retropepsin-like aspartic protease [Candidatus Omnitrophota bacterium]